MWWIILGGATGVAAITWAIVAALRSDRNQAIFDNQRLDTTAGYTAANSRLRSLIGHTGTTATDLRPHGTVTIETEDGPVRADARALDEYLVRGTAVRVTGVEDNALLVQRVRAIDN